MYVCVHVCMCLAFWGPGEEGACSLTWYFCYLFVYMSAWLFGGRGKRCAHSLGTSVVGIEDNDVCALTEAGQENYITATSSALTNHL